MNKKGFVTTLISIVLIIAVIVLVLIVVMTINSNGTNIIDAFFAKYQKPDIKPNNYFTTLYVGFVASDGKPMPPGQYPNRCSSTSTDRYACPVGTLVELYVVIQNTGGNAVSLFAYPLAGFNCQGTTSTCASLDWIDGYEACLTSPDGPTVDCSTKNTYVLSKKGTYRIFPGGKCMSTDCYDPDNPTAPFVPEYNPANYIEITTS